MILLNVVIRTDSSSEIGTGHVMRCLTLAKQLYKKGAKVRFICRDFSGNSISFIQSEGFPVDTLSNYVEKDHWRWLENNWEEDVKETRKLIENYSCIDLFIIDHYSLDIKWESKIRQNVKCIMVIDDIANRRHDCDILLDQNYYSDMKTRYNGLVPKCCIQLLGPNYVLLRNEFLTIETQKIKREAQVNNVLVFFGGSDPTDETTKTIQAIRKLNRPDIEFVVVVGSANPRKMLIKNICKEIENITFHIQVNNIAELMLKADLFIGAGGATTWERCFLKLPSITIIVAENQRAIAKAVDKVGATICLGESREVTSDMIANEVLRLDSNPNEIESMQKKCLTIMNHKDIQDKKTIHILLGFIANKEI